MGEVIAAHGLRGLVRVRAYQPPAPSLVPGRAVLLERAGDRWESRLTSVAPFTRGRLLVGLQDIGDRTAAAAVVGARLLVRHADLPPPGADEFYYHEVIDFRVETVSGELLGTIAGTMPTGQNDVWIVRAAGRELLIPVIADVVRAIDRPGRRVVIDPLPGLLD